MRYETIRRERFFSCLFVSNLIVLLLISQVCCAQTGWQAISSFGTNPGNLNMYSYAPTSITGNAPLVVVMHGCTQNAATVATQSGWNTLADRHKFYVVYPEQNTANNSSNCFNWFVSGDINRNQGEAYSIKQMVDYMKAHYGIDTTQVFVTGLSAGACMTNVMLACYPDVFSAGAVMAGAPYKAGANALYGFTTNTPAAWGDSVKTAYPTYTGSYPRVSVFQGSADPVVSPTNETEIMKQWTNVHGAGQTPATTISSFNGNPYVIKNVYNDPSGNEVMETYTLSGMGHAIALDTGSCYQQCGQTGTYALEVYFSSTFWAAYFFHILNNNAININGITTVTVSQTGVTYSVTNTASTTYTWTVPTGATITSGQGTNQVMVNFGTSSGNVSVTETNSVSCLVGPFDLYVTVGGTTGINQLIGNSEQLIVYPNPANTIINVELRIKDAELIIMDVMGNVVKQSIINNFKSIIDVADLPAGVYQFIIHNSSFTITKKVVIVR